MVVGRWNVGCGGCYRWMGFLDLYLDGVLVLDLDR